MVGRSDGAREAVSPQWSSALFFLPKRLAVSSLGFSAEPEFSKAL